MKSRFDSQPARSLRPRPASHRGPTSLLLKALLLVTLPLSASGQTFLTSNVTTQWSYDNLFVPNGCSGCIVLIPSPTYAISVPADASNLYIRWTKTLPQDVTLDVRFGGPTTVSAKSDYTISASQTLTLQRSSSLKTGTYYLSFSHCCARDGTRLANNGSLTASLNIPAIEVNPEKLSFTAIKGESNPPSQTLRISSGARAGVSWNLTAIGAGWLRLSPSSGVTPASITVSADTSGLANGDWEGEIRVTAAGVVNDWFYVPASLKLSVRPAIDAGGVVSAADSQPRLSRGSIASIYGGDFATTIARAGAPPLPRTLAGVRVTVNGIDAPLWYVRFNQINFQVPFEAPMQGTVPVIVYRDDVPSLPRSVALVPNAPAVFLYERTAGVIDPIVTRADSAQLITPASPASPGDRVIVWGTGIGDLTSVPATGMPTPPAPLAASALTPVITIGGAKAQVEWAGLTPESIGLIQFNVRLPDELPSGTSLPLVIDLNGAVSVPVKLAVKQ